MCDWSLAKSAAHVHDAKPEGDVHSILSNPYENYRSTKFGVRNKIVIL